MGGPTRGTRARQQQQEQQQQQQQRDVPPPSRLQASSGNTTIFDDPIAQLLNDGYATPQKSETVSPRIEPSRLSHSSEPLAIRQPSDHLLDDPHRSVATATVGNESDPLGLHLKEVISVISRLEGLGLQRQSIPLPKCVVLGEQSSGKSSVIEAISGVRTPRAGGTCTRCPLFIKLECSNDPQVSWLARVTLRLSYSFRGVTRGPKSKFPGWEANLNVPEVPFASCGSPDELEEVIRRAQLALVHPLEDVAIFSQDRASAFDPETAHSVNFTPNIVCVHVSSPTLPNLSFYDLPGIISQSENPDDVAIVKQLVQDYVQDPDAIVLVACSLAADIATSLASGYARNKWGAGDRCIGVLTKPDLLPAGSSDTPLQRVLSNAELKFGYGYFVVKNPDQVMLNNRLKHHDARFQEQEFFATNQPWSTSLRSHRGRFGTPNLQDFLSKKLAGQMIKALPVIYDQVQVRLDDVDSKLRNMPEPPTHGAARIIMDLLIAFSDHVRREMEGSYPCKDWRNSWKDLKDEFFEGLDAIRPTMRTRGRRDHDLYTPAGKSSDDPLCLSDGDDDETVGLPRTPSSKRKLENTPTPPSNKKGRFSVPPVPTPQKNPPVNGVDYNGKRTVFQLDEVCQHLNANSHQKIPGHIEWKVVDDLIRQTIAHWRVPTDKLFNDLENRLKHFIRLTFEQYFQARKDTKLYIEAWKAVENILATSLTEVSTMAYDSYNDEVEGPYTYHEAIFNNEKKTMREKYRDARFETRLRIYMEEMAKHVGEEKVPSKDKLRKNDNLCIRLKEEPYEVEVDVVAKITSYYVFAVRRFHDAVCMRVESKFFAHLRTRFRDDMDDTLGINGEDGSQKATELLAEPLQHAARRRELIAMREALLQGQRELDALHEKHGDQLTASQGSNGYVAPTSSASFGPTSTPLTDEMMDITQSGRVRR